MEKHDFQENTLDQLRNGTIFRSDDGRIAVIGETDVIAFKDDHGWQVAENVYFDNVEDLADTDVLPHRLTAKDLPEINGMSFYAGPLAPAIEFVKKHKEHDADPKRDITSGSWSVTLQDGNIWGQGDTPEMAWRFALGALFGPADDEFMELDLK